jgi:DNA-binding IclR family transcriptional regulator
MDEAALLARFGSELADDGLLILSVLKAAGKMTLEQISSRLALDFATVDHALRRLSLAGLVTPANDGAGYQAGGKAFDDLIRALADAEPARGPS